MDDNANCERIHTGTGCQCAAVTDMTHLELAVIMGEPHPKPSCMRIWHRCDGSSTAISVQLRAELARSQRQLEDDERVDGKRKLNS